MRFPVAVASCILLQQRAYLQPGFDVIYTTQGKITPDVCFFIEIIWYGLPGGTVKGVDPCCQQDSLVYPDIRGAEQLPAHIRLRYFVRIIGDYIQPGMAQCLQTVTDPRQGCQYL